MTSTISILTKFETANMQVKIHFEHVSTVGACTVLGVNTLILKGFQYKIKGFQYKMKGLQYKMKGFELNIKGFSLKLKEFQNPGSEKVFLTPFQQKVILTWTGG